jgi:hypothetical protein
MRRVTLLLCLVMIGSLFGVWGSADAAQKPIPIGSCNYIANNPGRTYRLLHDLTCPAAGIRITGANITLDLGGFTLTGSDDGTPTLWSGVTFDQFSGRATLKNGKVTNWEFDGVFANSSGPVVISNVASVGNGRVSSSGDGFRLAADAVTVTNSVAAGNPGEGLDVFAFGGPVAIRSTTSARNGSEGILINNASKPSVIGSTVTANFDRGIDITADNASVRSSRVINNGDTGTEQGVRITGNLARVESNEVSGNFYEGVLVTGTDAKINGNRTEGNGWGVADSLGNGIFVSGTATGTKNISRGNEGPDPQCSPVITCSTGAADVPASKNPIVVNAGTCGGNLDQPGRIYTITADVACPANGFAITADNITLDLGGHTLSNNSGVKTGSGVFLAGTGVERAQVRNGTILRWRGGIETNPSNVIERITVSNVAFVDNGEEGIEVYAPLTLSRSSALSNSASGVFVEDGGVRVSTSTLAGNGGQGLWISTPAGNAPPIVSGVKAIGNGGVLGTEGMRISADKPRVRSSVVSGSHAEGILISAVSVVGAKVDKNVTDGNGFGLVNGDGRGIFVTEDVASGRNRSRGNDGPIECDPGNLC